MTDEEYRAEIYVIDEAYNRAIRKALCKRQNLNKTFERLPELIFYTRAALEAAEQRDKQTDGLEVRFYRAQGYEV